MSLVNNYVIENKLLDIRLRAGYKTQKSFADFLGIDRNDYNKIENNKKQVGIKLAFMIAMKLNMKVDDIFYLKKIESNR